MTAQKKTEDESILEQLAANIHKGHRRCIDGIKGLIAQAKGIAAWLDEAKKLVGHGRWTAWVEDNCHVSPRMAQEYRLVARHYDAPIALLGTKDELTLTEFFRLAARMQAEAKQAHAVKGEARPDAGPGKKAPADAFRLEKGERTKKVKEVERRKQHGPLPVERCDPVRNFLEEQGERLLGAIKRFACSKKAKEVVGDLDPAHLGILLVESLKARLDAKEQISRPADADATDATKPAGPTNRIGHLLNGKAKKTAA